MRDPEADVERSKSSPLGSIMTIAIVATMIVIPAVPVLGRAAPVIATAPENGDS
jgi:hypothetical protein